MVVNDSGLYDTLLYNMVIRFPKNERRIKKVKDKKKIKLIDNMRTKLF